MADARGRAYRKSHASGSDDVRKWVGKWWGDTGDLEIRQFTINVPAPSMIRKIYGDEVFITAFRNKVDSALHSLLKYAAWNWLSRKKSVALPCQSNLIRFEQQIYSPSHAESEFRDVYHPLGGEFDGTMAQLLRRGDNTVCVGDGHKSTVDVFGKGTNIEVGNTQPFNLLTPVTDLLSMRAVWVPFPTGLHPKDFVLDRDKLGKAVAYEIKYA